MTKEVTAELRDWRMVDARGGKVIIGHVYGDKRQRFRNGEKITTSRIRRIEDGIAYTLYSTYKLGECSFGVEDTQWEDFHDESAEDLLNRINADRV